MDGRKVLKWILNLKKYDVKWINGVNMGINGVLL
jgi:hypothetical protein